MLNVGDKAPAFTLPNQDGKPVTLKEFAGKPVVIYFYPKDDTPGCTREACAFRDEYKVIGKLGAVVLGVSKDGVGSHRKFADKYALPFDLLADPETTMIQAYGVWGEKKNYGKAYMGIIRTTYLIDAKGKVQAVWSPVKVDGHADEVLAALKA